MPGLTPKQERFVQEYLIDLNATQAAIRAGYSAKTAHVIGPENLEKPDIKAAVARALDERSKRVQVDADYVLRRLYEMAEANMNDLCHKETGDLLPVSEWPEVWQKGMISGIEIDALYEGRGEDRVQIGHTKKIKQVERLSVLQTLGKHVRVNAFQETVNHVGLDALGDRLERAAKRGG